MRSRMERYQENNISSARSTKNNSLYEELYREKPNLSSNVTVLDNVNEIDINKIKKMVDSRENYRKNRSYESIMKHDISSEKSINYEFDEINDKDYDINEIIEKKRTDRQYINEKKIRKLNSKEYEELKKLIIKDSNIASKLDDDSLTREEQLTEIINTLVQNEEVTDLFANLKEDVNENIEEVEQVQEKEEDTFYTKNNKFDDEDFKADIESSGSKIFVIIVIIALLIAAGIFVWFKFFK